MALLFLASIVLALWAVGVFIVPISLPLFHLLLAIGATLLVVAWARRT
ncbi:MAG: hypothetical protein ACREMH_02295 [Gemmatimonadales bacterium]